MSNAILRAIEGTKDLVGLDAARYDRIQAAAAEMFGRYGYRHIVTPMFERTELFSRSIGAATDIVEKEMYTFTPGSDTITLRPEGTAGVVRAYLQHNLAGQGGLQKLWYAGPMFRRERPQKGRQRQFNQVGVEALGAVDPLLDAETIALGLRFYGELGIEGTRLRLNSIGCQRAECRPRFRESLREAIRPRLAEYCPTCRQRFERNVLRVLDCKNPACRALSAGLPKSHENLCEECAGHFEVVQEALEAHGADFALDPTLVRGLDYYTKTVFEYVHGALGAQDAMGGGGRYDGLVEALGGPPTPAVGFALGVERIMIALDAAGGCACQAPLVAFGIGLGEGARRAMAGMMARVREAGMSMDMDYEGRSFKAQMRAANRREALFCLILGDDELGRGEMVLKDMRPEAGEQRPLPLDRVVDELRRALRTPPGRQ